MMSQGQILGEPSRTPMEASTDVPKLLFPTSMAELSIPTTETSSQEDIAPELGTVAIDEEEITPNAVAVSVVKVVKDDERLVADTVAPPPATKVTKPIEPGLSFLVQRLLLPTLLSIVQGFTKGCLLLGPLRT